MKVRAIVFFSFLSVTQMTFALPEPMQCNQIFSTETLDALANFPANSLANSLTVTTPQDVTHPGWQPPVIKNTLAGVSRISDVKNYKAYRVNTLTSVFEMGSFSCSGANCASSAASNISLVDLNRNYGLTIPPSPSPPSQYTDAYSASPSVNNAILTLSYVVIKEKDFYLWKSLCGQPIE